MTVAIVFDILLVALAAITEATKRSGRGLLEFLALAGLGCALGFALSLMLVIEISWFGGTSLAEP